MSEGGAQLNELQKDALREVGNIGAGHSATALSLLLDTKVNLTTPHVEVVKFRELADRMHYGERTVAVLHMHVRGAAPGRIVVLFDRKQAQDFVDAFIKRLIGDIKMFDSIKDSTLMELGNIIAGSYLTAIIELTGVDLILSVPTLAYGTVDEALQKLMTIDPNQDVFLIENSFLDKDKEISGQFLLIPETGSITPLLAVFGVE
ncbi:MAG: chemotaxis protein CheC [Vulcanimicrobiaceae bacterium]